MTPQYYRTQARRFRKIAAQQPDTDIAKRLSARADENDHAADLLTELNKINAALADAAPAPIARTNETLH